MTPKKRERTSFDLDVEERLADPEFAKAFRTAQKDIAVADGVANGTAGRRRKDRGRVHV